MKHKLKPFHYSPTQNLDEDDFPKQIELCEWFALLTEEGDNFPR